MRFYRQKEVHDVKVIYIENSKARVTQKIYTTGRYVWALLPDGRIGCNDAEFFKWASVGTQQRDVLAAEALWRLGAIRKDVYLKVKSAQEKHQQKRNRSYAIDEFKRAAQILGIELTAAQKRIVNPPANSAPK